MFVNHDHQLMLSSCHGKLVQSQFALDHIVKVVLLKG